jgi:hypothetical protein
MTSMNGDGLRAVLEHARASGYTAGQLTVLAVQRDPFRLDTPARHRDGRWLQEHADRLGLEDRTFHLRGLHYMLVSGEATKPNGFPYTNTEEDWVWMSEDAAKAARWLGYIPFEQIVDARNSEPTIVVREQNPLEPWISVGVQVEIPEADELEPQAGIDGFVGVQPFKLVLFGEKTSLQILGHVAAAHQADLYLPSGEISDTLVHQMASIGAQDGRRMVVLCFSDCDPAGWQMPISIARKLQAFRALAFPELDFEVHRCALTPEHVRQYGLPSTPLKATELRADRWMQATGTEQTEIDALAALQPELLRQVAVDAVAPFYDETLNRRVAEARAEWVEEAQARLDAQIDQGQLERLRAEATEKLATLRDEIDAINEALRAETGDEFDFDFPEPVVPEAETNGRVPSEPLLDSDWDWVEQTLRLKDSKAYREEGF